MHKGASRGLASESSTVKADRQVALRTVGENPHQTHNLSLNLQVNILFNIGNHLFVFPLKKYPNPKLHNLPKPPIIHQSLGMD